MESKFHKKKKNVITDLNALYKSNPSMYEKQFSPEGFEWISYDDHQNAVLAFIRKGNNPKGDVIVVCNFTPVVRTDYRIGLPRKGKLVPIFNSDDERYGGSGVTNEAKIKIDKEEYHGRAFSASLVLPPMAVVAFKIS